MQLEPEQEQLFMEMAEATLAAPRDQREWTVFEMAAGAILVGPGGQRPVIATDVEQLAIVGLLRPISYGPATYMLAPESIAAYGEMKASDGSGSSGSRRRFGSSSTVPRSGRRTRRRTSCGRTRSAGCGRRTLSAN